MWRTKLAIYLLRSAGHEVAIELRSVKQNTDRPGIIGKRLERFQTLRAGLRGLARTQTKPGISLVLSVRAALASRTGAQTTDSSQVFHPKVPGGPMSVEPVEPMPGNDDLDPQSDLRMFDEASDVPPQAWERKHECNVDGPLIPIDGEYRMSCSLCGEPQPEP